VWQTGHKLPAGYHGCVADGQVVAVDGLGCSSGQRMVRYGDHWYAVRGGAIHHAAKTLNSDKQYFAMISRCRG
jgi:hypothetical protein